MTQYTTPEEIAAEIATRIAQIDGADGWITEIGTRIFHGRVQVDDDVVPCCSIVEGADQVQTGPSQRMAMAHIKQQYALVAYLACDANSPNTAARQAIRDIKRAIFRTNGAPSKDWGGKVRSVNYQGRNIGPRADGKPLVMAVVEIEVEYAEDLAA